MKNKKPSAPGGRRGIPAALVCLAGALLLLAGAPLRAEDDASTDEHVHIVDDSTLDVDSAAMANLSITTVALESYPDVLAIMGSISPIENRVTSVPSRVAGRIDSVLRVTGEYVQAGDALALEYSPDYIETRKEYLDARKSQFSDYSELAASSRKKLMNMGLSSRDIARLGRPGDDPDHLVLRASHAGAITAVNTAVGNMQNQGDALMTISDLDQVWFTGDLFPEDLSKVRAGQHIEVETEGLSNPLGGKISFISPVIDSNAHTIKVRAVIENPDRMLREGMVVEGDVVLSRRTALVVPAGALMNLHGRWYCFKRIGPQRFREIPVTEGQEVGDTATVVQGLVQGDQVVSGGNLVLDYTFSGD